MLKLKILLFYGLTLIAAIAASRAFALTEDFNIPAVIDMGAGIDSLAVSNDRFVISLNKTAKSLIILDTWNWRNAGTISLGNTVEVVAMAENPGGTRLYFAIESDPSDYIAWMDISSLKTLAFNANITATAFKLTPITGITPYINPVTEIGVIQAMDDPTVDCIFPKVKDLSTSNIYYLSFIIFQNNTVLNSGDTVPNGIGANIDISISPNRLFAVTNTYVSGINSSSLYGYLCRTDYVTPYIDDFFFSTVSAPQQYLGIGTDYSGADLTIGESSTKNLLLYKVTGSSGALQATLADTTPLPQSAKQIWTKKINAEPNPMVLFSQTTDASKLYIMPLASGKFYPKDATSIPLSGSSLLLADSSSTDGFIYIAPKGATSLSVLTANPWIKDLTTDISGVCPGSTFNISFKYDTGSSYVVAVCPNFAVSSANCGKVVSQGPLASSPATVVINSTDVGGGDHVLGVFVLDSRTPAHSGRNAIPVSIPLPPEINDFKLQFGNQKIIISFKTASVTASTVYKVYYGTNGSAPPDHPEEIDDTGGDGSPPSPIEITTPLAHHTYSYTVENVANNQTYYAQIVATETQCQTVAVSERKSTIPQLTSTLTDLTGESGGFDCSMGISGAARTVNLMDLLFLACPLIILVILKIRLRSGK